MQLLVSQLQLALTRGVPCQVLVRHQEGGSRASLKFSDRLAQSGQTRSVFAQARLNLWDAVWKT
jgi:hypothetical protein